MDLTAQQYPIVSLFSGPVELGHSQLMISNIGETQAVARSFLDLVPDESVTCRLTV
jgi:hypothetical protein